MTSTNVMLQARNLQFLQIIELNLCIYFAFWMETYSIILKYSNWHQHKQLKHLAAPVQQIHNYEKCHSCKTHIILFRSSSFSLSSVFHRSDPVNMIHMHNGCSGLRTSPYGRQLEEAFVFSRENWTWLETMKNVIHSIMFPRWNPLQSAKIKRFMDVVHPPARVEHTWCRLLSVHLWKLFFSLLLF